MSKVTIRCGDFVGEENTALVFIDVLSEIDEWIDEEDYQDWSDEFYIPISDQIDAHNSKETMDALAAAVESDDEEKFAAAMANFVQPELKLTPALAQYFQPLIAEYLEVLGADLEELAGEDQEPSTDEEDDEIGFEVMKFWCARDLISAIEVCLETGDDVIIDAAPSDIQELTADDSDE